MEERRSKQIQRRLLLFPGDRSQYNSENRDRPKLDNNQLLRSRGKPCDRIRSQQQAPGKLPMVAKVQ